MYLYINDSVMDWNDELFQASTPSPTRFSYTFFSIRFPYYIGAWDRLIRNGEIFWMNNTEEPRSTNTCR